MNGPRGSCRDCLLAGLLFALVAATPALSAAADEATITFEDLTPRTEVGSVEPGVTFSAGVTAVDFSSRPGFAHSGVIGVEQCYRVEFCNNPFVITFPAPQAQVSLWVGYAAVLRQATTLMLTAYDTAGKQITSDSKTLAPTGGVIPIDTPMVVASTRNDIASASLTYDGTAGLSGGYAIDDVAFRSAPPVAAPDVTIGGVTQQSVEDGRMVVLTVGVVNRGEGRAAATMLHAAVAGWAAGSADVAALGPRGRAEVSVSLAVPDSARGSTVTAHLTLDPVVGERVTGNNARDVRIVLPPPPRRWPWWRLVLAAAALLLIAALVAWIVRRWLLSHDRVQVVSHADPHPRLEVGGPDPHLDVAVSLEPHAGSLTQTIEEVR